MALCRWSRQPLMALALLFCGIMSLSTAQATPDKDCQKLLKPASKVGDTTDQLLSYLAELNASQMLPELSIVALLEKIEVDSDLIFHYPAPVSTTLQIHERSLNLFLRQPDIDRNKLAQWLEETLAIKQGNQSAREIEKQNTISLIRELKWKPIQGGAFGFRNSPTIYATEDANKPKDVQLTHQFEMSDSHITQYQWAQIMGTNPSTNKTGEGSIEVEINGKMIQMKPNHPVENITWWSALEFANRLSIVHGLKPAYKLDHIKFLTGTSAEKGNLSQWISYNQTGPMRFKYDAKVNHIFGDIYKTEGYRLPTAAEQLFLRIMYGESPENQKIKNDKAKQDDALMTSAEQTLSVEEFSPDIVFGQEFFGLSNNVAEWSWDKSWDKLKGKNPVNVGGRGVFRSICGKSWYRVGHGYDSFTHGSDPYCRVLEADQQKPTLGIRLVRTLKKHK